MRIEREEGKEYILSLSYGKDSLACLGAIEQLGWPLDRIVHAEVWATDTIPADLPPMVEFKAKADEIIKERWGIEVEHVCAMRNGEKITYEKLFYHVPSPKFRGGYTEDLRQSTGIGASATSSNQPCGWPHAIGGWCSKLKIQYVRLAQAPGRLVQEAQGAGTARPFPTRAGRGAKQIPSSTLGLRQMSQSGSSATQSRDLRSRWSKPAGTKHTAADGARITTCSVRYTQQLRAADAGSATIKE